MGSGMSIIALAAIGAAAGLLILYFYKDIL